MALATSRCAVGSGIMYGVGRSPLMLAAEARDLDELSGGRFVLGLGNGTRRMISDWHGQDGAAPAARMEELVPLIRSIWRLEEGPVDHRGASTGSGSAPWATSPRRRGRSRSTRRA